MPIVTDTISLSTRGDSEIQDLTARVQDLVCHHHFRHGQVLVFVSGSTAALTTIE